MSPFDDTDVGRSADLTPSDLAPVDLEAALARRGPVHRRVLGAIIAILLCAAFAAVVGYPLIGHVIPASASPSSNHSGTQVIVATNVTTAGVFTVNGHKRPDRMAVSFTPRDGDNTVILDAPPFAIHTCRFHWSNRQITATNGQCQTVGDSFASDASGTHSLEVEITMPLMPADLPVGAQQQAATEAIQRIASPAQTIIVPQGDYYTLGLDAGGAILSQRAATPLTATFSMIPDTTSLEPITLFLDGSGLTRHFPDHAWLIRANMFDSWQFTASDGEVVGGIAMETSATQQTEFTLDYTRSSFPRLHFTLFSPTPPPEAFPCGKGLWVLQAFSPITSSLQSLSDCVDRGLAGSAFSLIPVNGIGATGDATHMSMSAKTPAATTVPAQPRFLYRFGVLLTANAAAHTTAPQLPQAPADEIVVLGG